MQTGKGVGAGEAICEANCEVWAAWVALIMHRLVAAKAIQSFSLAMVLNFWLISKKGFRWGARSPSPFVTSDAPFLSF